MKATEKKRIQLKPSQLGTRGGQKHAPAAGEVHKIAERSAISVADLNVAALGVTELSFGRDKVNAQYITARQSARNKQRTQTYSEF